MGHRSFPGSVSRCRTAAAPPCWRPRASARPPCSGCSAAVSPPRAAASPGFRRRGSPWYSRRTVCCPAARCWKTCGWWLRRRPGHRTHRPAGRTGTVRLGKCPPRETLGRNAPPGSHCPGAGIPQPAGHHGRAVQGTGRSHPGSNPRLCGPAGWGARTFLLVTHSPQEAERLGCRITRLDELTRTGSEKQN